MSHILMTDKDKERWFPLLEEYFRDKDIPESDITNKIEKIFAECQLGWDRAPRDLDTRIKMKTGFQWQSHANLMPNRKKEEEAEIIKEKVDVADISLFDTMSKSEVVWWQERLSIYKKDFEFNDSSDKPLLDQLLVEELVQRRLFKLQLSNKERDLSKRLTDSMKRVTELQTKLGITREQRAGIMNKIDGNVAQLALSLNEKLENMPEKIKKDYEDELYYRNLKNQRPPINILPAPEKLQAMLNVDGEVSANLDSSRITEISEAVAKEIMNKKEESKGDKTELADGESI